MRAFWLLLLMSALFSGGAYSANSPEVYAIETNKGVIKIQLDAGPTETLANFKHYVNEGFYDGTLFHRVINGFMIQGGGFMPGMIKKPTDAMPIKHEGSRCHNNKRGVLSMARTSDPNSATAQFFINTADNAFLDYKSDTAQGWGYCGFADVIDDGMEVVDAIALVPTTSMGGYQDVPSEPVLIKKITLVTNN